MIPARGPRAVAEAMERVRRVPAGSGDRLAVYGSMGLAFESGDVVVFNRVVASSVGPPYSSVWHRSPAGAWTVYASVEPARSCPRYLGAALDRAVVTDVIVRWIGDRDLSVSAPAARIELSLRAAAGVRSAAVGAIVAGLPAPVRRWPPLLRLAGPLAGRGLGAGPLALTGRAPNGQAFALAPWRVWRVAGAAASVAGRDAGRVVPGSPDLRLGEIRVPAAPLLFAGEARYEAHDASLHRPARGRRETVRW